MKNPRSSWLLGVSLLCLVSACDGETPPIRRTAVQRGEALFRDRGISPNAFNPFACTTCHATGGDLSGRMLPGGTLAGVTKRPAFWAGQEPTLLGSVNVCLQTFLSDADGLSPEEDRARSLYAYLASLEGDGAAVPFTVVPVIADLPNGDATRGALVWDAACRTCHGAPRTGEGQLAGLEIRVPDDSVAEHVPKGDDVRLILIEKIRHGTFLGYSGRMPPFSLEVLSDADLSDLLSYLELDR